VYRLGSGPSLFMHSPVFHVVATANPLARVRSHRVNRPTTTDRVDDSDEWEVIGSWTAGSIAVRKGSGLLYLVVEKGFDNTPTPPVGNAWTPQMHAT